MGGPCFKGGRFKHGIFSWDSNGIRYKPNKYKGVDFAPRKKDKSPPAYRFIRIEHLKCFQHWLLSSWPITNGQVELKIVEPIFRLFVNGIAPGQGEVGVMSDLYGFYMVLNQLWPNPRSMINDRSDRCMDRMDIYWVITQLDLRKTLILCFGLWSTTKRSVHRVTRHPMSHFPFVRSKHPCLHEHGYALCLLFSHAG